MKIVIDTGLGGVPAAKVLVHAANGAVQFVGVAPSCANYQDEVAAVSTALAGTTVARGAEKPMLRADAPLGTAPKAEKTAQTAGEHAVNLLWQQAQQAPVTLVYLGPLTNAALALLKYPQLAEKLEKIIVAGGAQLGYGRVAWQKNGVEQVSCGTEESFLQDPEAADTVFKSGVPVVMVPQEAAQDYRMAACALALNGDVAKESYTAFIDMDVSGSSTYGQCVIDPIGHNPITGETHGGQKSTVVSAVDEALIAQVLAEREA